MNPSFFRGVSAIHESDNFVAYATGTGNTERAAAQNAVDQLAQREDCEPDEWDVDFGGFDDTETVMDHVAKVDPTYSPKDDPAPDVYFYVVARAYELDNGEVL
jgi:hypothetical protein